MATILLQAAGAYLGGFLGSTGAAIGTAVGAIAGYTLDRALINSTRRIEGPRLASAPPFTAEDGAPLPRLYGTARLGGTLIWATRFEEASTTTRQGFKGGPRLTEYAYYVSAAFALCEGEIAGVRRIWADGRELDRTLFEIRVHRGTEDQDPDPLIAASRARATRRPIAARPMSCSSGFPSRTTATASRSSSSRRSAPSVRWQGTCAPSASSPGRPSSACRRRR